MLTINIQHVLATAIILAVLPSSLVFSQTTQADLCMFAFSQTGFVLTDVSKFPEFFKDDSTMTLAQAGNYKGAESIAEYVRFALSSSPYFATGPDNEAFNFLYTNFDAPNNICEFLSVSKDRYSTDPAATRYATEFSNTIMFKIFFDIQNVYVTRVNVFYPTGFLSLFFDVLLNSDKTRDFVCSTMSDPCNLPPSTKRRCMENLKSLPTTINSYVDSNSQGCRALHAVFAAANPQHHCAHLSFTPMLDPDNSIKCQESSNILPSDLFDAADFAIFNAFMIEQGIDPDVGHDENYESITEGKKKKSKLEKADKKTRSKLKTEGKKAKSELKTEGKKTKSKTRRVGKKNTRGARR